VLDEEHHSHPDNGPDHSPADSGFGGLDSEDPVAGVTQSKPRRRAKAVEPDADGDVPVVET
jgi:hypothetical protein